MFKVNSVASVFLRGLSRAGKKHVARFVPNLDSVRPSGAKHTTNHISKLKGSLVNGARRYNVAILGGNRKSEGPTVIGTPKLKVNKVITQVLHGLIRDQQKPRRARSGQYPNLEQRQRSRKGQYCMDLSHDLGGWHELLSRRTSPCAVREVLSRRTTGSPASFTSESKSVVPCYISHHVHMEHPLYPSHFDSCLGFPGEGPQLLNLLKIVSANVS